MFIVTEYAALNWVDVQDIIQHCCHLIYEKSAKTQTVKLSRDMRFPTM